MATARQTQVLYITYFARPADPSGLDYWSSGDRLSQPLKQTAEGFATTPEFAASIAGLTNGQVIDKYYENLFGRQRQAGETYWLDKVNKGEITLAEAGYWISQGAQGQDKVTLDAKLVAADQWTVAVRANPTANFNYNGELAATLGVDFLQPVLGPSTIPTPAATVQAVAAIPAFGTIGFIEASTQSVTEGSTVIFSLQTIPSLAGQSLNYEIVGAGGLSAADIVGGQLTGSILVDANGVASLAVTLATDAVVDPGESFTVVIPNAISAPAVTVVNTTVPSLTVTPQPTGVNEGESITFLIASSAIAAGTALNYTISGVQAADVVGPLTGTVIVGAGGTVPSVVIQIATDLFIETETLQFSITGGGATGTASVVIQDTSPPAKINVAAQPSSVAEGQTLTYLINTTGIAVGSLLTYTITGITAADVLGGSAVLSGTRTVGTGGLVDSVVIQIKEDLVLAETETATLTITNGAVTGSAVAIIVDTTPAPALSVTPQPTGVNEGASVNFLIASIGIAEGTVLNYTLSGVQAADVVGPLFGSVVVGAGGVVPSVLVQIATDLLVETETLIFNITGGGATGTASVVIQDTTPAPALSVTAQPTAVNEGSVLTYTISTTSVAPGTVLSYVITGIQAADVLGGAAVLTGTRTVNPGGSVAPVQITIATDLLVGEQETATITVSGAGLTAQASAQIVDTSSNVLNLTVNQDIFVETGVTQDLIFSAPVVPGGLFGFNTLQNFDSLVGGLGFDQLIAGLTGPSVVQPLALLNIEEIRVTSLTGSNTLSLLTSNSVVLLENYSSEAKLTFSNIPAVAGPGLLPTVSIFGTNKETELQFQPVALTGIQNLDVVTTASGTGGNPLKITTGPGIETASILDSVQVPGFLVDYDLSAFPIPAIEISSPNAINLAGRVSTTTFSIDGSDITGSFTVDLSAQAGSSSVQGGAGDDVIQSRQGNSTLVGNGGNDSLLSFSGGDDSLNGGNGNDTLNANGGNNIFDGGNGDDSLFSGDGNDSASAGSGNDRVNLGGGNNTATGGEGLDTITTLGGNDTIAGGANSDSVSSGAGNDAVTGDEGDDFIDFGTGFDQVSGGLGNDYFVGELTPQNNSFDPTDTINGDGDVNTLEITAANADAVAVSTLGTPFVDNIQILNINGIVGADALSNEVNAFKIDSTIATIKLLNGTGATASVFTFNPGSSFLYLGGALGAAATFNVVGTGAADSLTISGPPSLTNYLAGQNLTFNGFDANTVTINTGIVNQTIGTLTATPTVGQDSRFVFQGNGGVSLNQVTATAGNLTLDFTGIANFFALPFAVVNGTDVTPGNGVTILGSAGSDTFVGDTAQPNTIQSFGGNDLVTVGAGNDSVLAGTGNDTINPGTGNDTVLGEAGNDRFNVGSNLTLLDRFDGGLDIDTIQLTGKLGDPLNIPFTQGWTASDLEGVRNFEILELDVIEDPLPLVLPNLITVQDLFNFTINGNTIQTVNLTDFDNNVLGSALLFNAPTSLVNLGILETLENVTVQRRIDTSSDTLNVTLVAGADLQTLTLNDEENLNFIVNGVTTINTLFAADLRSLSVSGSGSFVITNPIVGATQLSVLNLSGFSVNSISIDASVSAVDMTVTGPVGDPITPIPYQLNLVTGSGNDNITALGYGANTINANAGNDTIQTDGFNDSLTGGLGNDSISSGGGNDTVFADQGNDTVDAGAGNDVVFGDLNNIAGNDSLFGGIGNDTLSGGLGADTINGGAGIDTYESGFTVDLIPPGVQDPASTGQIIGQVVNISNVNLERSYITQVTGESVASSIQFVAAGTANYLYNLPLPLFGGSPVTDILSNIENVTGTVDGNDFLIGSGDITTEVALRDTQSTQNVLNGLSGNDTYQGGYGTDTFINDLGADTILDLGLVASGGYEQILVNRLAVLPIPNPSITINATLGGSWIAGLGDFGLNSINNGQVTLGLNGYNADLSNSEGTGLYIVNGTAADESVIGSNNADCIYGGAGNDTLIGLGGDDNIFGGVGNDSIEGSLGNDSIDGGLGDDTIDGGLGDDTIFGGSGNDSIEGSLGNDSIDSDLGDDTIDGGLGDDTIFGGQGADLIDGGEGDDSVFGGSYPDTIFGGIGNDFLVGFDGLNLNDPTDGDSINGEEGNDTIQGNDAADSLFGGLGLDSIAGGTGNDSIGGGTGSDIIDGGDGADQIFGGAGIDSIQGGLEGDTILGEGDDDTIDAGDGLDSVIGGEGNDSIIGGLGSDSLFGGLGNDTFTGNEGDDTIGSDEGSDSALGGIGNDTISLGIGDDTLFGEAGNDSLNGGAGNDSIDGDAGDDSIDGGAGNDTLAGGTGNDTIDGGIGNDSIEGNDGTDSLLGGAGDDTVLGGLDADTIAGGLDNDSIIGGFGSDNIDGGEGDDRIFGGQLVFGFELDLLGNDSISGGNGNDTIDGGAADDALEGGLGNDSIQGGAGTDFISGGDGSDNIDGGAEDDLILGGNGNDTIQGGNGNDIIDGEADDDTINGGNGDDNIDGGFGNDSIDGGNGNDTIVGGGLLDLVGDDTIFGGNGDDTISGALGNDSIDGGNGNDTIGGSAGNDTILGGNGNDVINGDPAILGSGDDSIDGGNGNDTIDGGGSNDTITGGNGDDTIDGGSGDDTIDGGFGNDTIDGGSGDDTITGGNDNDTISGGTGDDTIGGGNGNDTISGGNGNDNVAGDDGDDTISGGNQNDTISGGNGNDTITGDNGDDTIGGGSGNDTISGGNGNDTIAGGDGEDTIAGGNGNDTISGGNGNDTISGDDGDDTISGGIGNETISGGNGNDTIAGDDGNDTIAGGIGNDTIAGGNGNDTIAGDEGDDTIAGGNDNDTISGGTGNDTIAGDDGDDTIAGGIDNDTISGGNGNDNLAGDDGNDTIAGGNGTDTINGGNGNDSIIGGAGVDLITGGAGFNTFAQSQVDSAPGVLNEAGGSSATTFDNGDKVTFASGVDRITDFNSASNQLATATGLGVSTQSLLWTNYIAGGGYYTRGSFNTGTNVFTVDYAAGNDILYFESASNSGPSNTNFGTGSIILQNAGATNFNSGFSNIIQF